MNVLAIELSTQVGSVALFRNDAFIHEYSWDSSGRRNQEVMHHLQRLLNRTKTSLNEINAYAVGRGPGNYSGLRTALAAAQALALPTHDRLLPVSSARALAREVIQRSSKNTVTVLGDARRRALWAGTFRDHRGTIRQDGDFVLIPYHHAPRFGFAPGPLVSSERARIKQHLGAKTSDLVGSDWYPSARMIGLLALDILAGKTDPEPPELIYMHPPVDSQTSPDEDPAKGPNSPESA